LGEIRLLANLLEGLLSDTIRKYASICGMTP